MIQSEHGEQVFASKPYLFYETRVVVVDCGCGSSFFILPD
jgi:hypothetical protein